MTLPLLPPDQLTERENRMLTTLLTPPRKQMPLSTFEKDFLPFLSSVPVPADVIEAMLARMERQTNQKHTVSDLIGNMLNSWMEYHATPGAPYMYVEVLQGQDVVYVVPPLLDNREVLLDGVTAQTLTAIASQSANLSMIHANLADNFVKENLLPLVTKAEPNPEYLKMWNIIYEYHGLPLLKLQDGKFQSTVEGEGQRTVNADGSVVEADGSFSDIDEYD